MPEMQDIKRAVGEYAFCGLGVHAMIPLCFTRDYDSKHAEDAKYK
jgi:hypothetical protein